ncbi:MAG TPA: hypothetical protein VLD67_04090 [Vicinamibacterales bacterium]|nr:hypothetical protein [Vicinamibacterales bacterium]
MSISDACRPFPKPAIGRIVAAFSATTERYRLIPAGTPDPYTTPGDR